MDTVVPIFTDITLVELEGYNDLVVCDFTKDTWFILSKDESIQFQKNTDYNWLSVNTNKEFT